jgi:hypothetical protein
VPWGRERPNEYQTFEKRITRQALGGANRLKPKSNARLEINRYQTKSNTARSRRLQAIAGSTARA